MNEVSNTIRRLEELSNEFRNEFSGLSSEQLNMKISPDSWSVAQCIDHLIVTNRSYLPQLKGIAEGRQQKNFWSSVPFLPGIFGSMLKKSVSPQSNKKLSTMKPFEPSQSTIEGNIIQKFDDSQNELNAQLAGLSHINLKTTMITSPAARAVTYSFSDLLSILVLHEERHLQQAIRTAKKLGLK